MRLRAKDITFARSPEYLDPYLSVSRGARTREKIIQHATAELHELGYKLKKKKGPKGWKAKRMSTTLWRTVWLGVNWDSKSPHEQAATLMHELVHARQYRGIKRFLPRYVADSRFRFAVETHAYRETCRAYRAMGLSERSIKAYAEDLPNRFIKSYWILGRRMRKAVRRYMERIVVAR